MATYTKELLSGSTNGRQILVAAVDTPGTLIHTAITGTSSKDEVWLYACNTDITPAILVIEWGGVTDPNDTMIVTLPAQDGDHLIKAGLPINNGLVIRAYSSVANVIVVSGFVNRIS